MDAMQIRSAHQKMLNNRTLIIGINAIAASGVPVGACGSCGTPERRFAAPTISRTVAISPIIKMPHANTLSIVTAKTVT